jgi:ADP-ribose pyrophosphatase YjhB (NUDIX family)
METLRRNIPYKTSAAIEVLEAGTQVITRDPSTGFQNGSKILEEDYLAFPKSKTMTLYDGRYTAVVGFVFAYVKGKWCVLANKRGKNTPDFQGMWNCPCGFLERNEDQFHGIAREVAEECCITIPASYFKMVEAETDPATCNNGNVSLRHVACLEKNFNKNFTRLLMNENGGEVGEVDDIKWIPVKDIDKYRWAFHHKDVILPMFKKLTFMQKFHARFF